MNLASSCGILSYMEAKKSKRYELLFSDTEMGHPDLGWMPRRDDVIEDDEDFAYRKFLRNRGIVARVRDGYAWVEET